MENLGPCYTINDQRQGLKDEKLGNDLVGCGCLRPKVFTGERMCSLAEGARSVKVRQETGPSEDHLKVLQARLNKLEVEANSWAKLAEGHTGKRRGWKPVQALTVPS